MRGEKGLRNRKKYKGEKGKGGGRRKKRQGRKEYRREGGKFDEQLQVTESRVEG